MWTWSVRGPSHGLIHVTIIRLTFRLFIFVYNKVPINARSDWLKERALSEYRARLDEGGPISVFASAF